MTLRHSIHSISSQHLSKGFHLYGQNLTAVGFVGGTVPNLTEEEGVIELPNSDASNAYIVVGSALMGKRPFYVIRYSGFNHFNAVAISNYASKSKELWNRPCPIFGRSIAMSGRIGPVASNNHISLYYKMPGLKIMSPMTPAEYQTCYNEFMEDDEPYIISEHRWSYDNDKELPSILEPFHSQVSLLPLGITRFSAQTAQETLKKQGITSSIIHTFRIKPFLLTKKEIRCLQNSRHVLIIDDDYPDGIAKSITFDLSKVVGHNRIEVLGLEERSAGFSKETDLLPPNAEQIVKFIKERML